MLDDPEIRAKRLNGQLWYEIDDIQDLDIAGTGDDGLVGLGVVDHMEGGILLVELVQALSLIHI